jgi:hypothetical protein
MSPLFGDFLFFEKSPRQEETLDRRLPKAGAYKHGLSRAFFRFEREA